MSALWAGLVARMGGYWLEVALGLAAVASVALLCWRIGVWHDAYGTLQATEKSLATRTEKLRQCQADVTAAQAQYDEAALLAESVAVQDREQSQRIEHVLQERLYMADATGRDLARRLYNYQARAGGGAVCTAAGSTGEPAGAGTQSRDGEAIERATADHFAACADDAVELDGWQQWWGAVKANH